jgi:hypothetical protein
MAGEAEAREAIYTAVVELLEDAKRHGTTTYSQMVRDAAVAYRLAKGGQQPGSSVVSS